MVGHELRCAKLAPVQGKYNNEKAMPIRRCSEQSRQTLEEFYLEISANTAYDVTGVGKGMLRLIDMINRLFKETLIWGLTSHARLLLLNADNSASACYVAIIGSSLEIVGIADYQFEYLIPADKQPWANAQMKGEAANLAEAERYLLIAMHESQGWEGNEELKRLMIERNLISQ